MDKDLKTLYNCAMSPLMQNLKHKYFFTQEEFENRKGQIYIIQAAIANVAKKIEQTTNNRSQCQNQTAGKG